jgi:hypothetical protein
LTTWAKTQTRLFSKLPDSETHVTDANRAEVQAALAEFFATVEGENERFIESAIDVFRSKLGRRFAIVSGIGARPLQPFDQLAG